MKLAVLLLLSAVARGQQCPLDCVCDEDHGITCEKMPQENIPRESISLTIKSHPRGLSFADFNPFAGNSIVILDMCSAGITSISPRAFSTMRKLIIIKLSNNHITSLNSNTFRDNSAITEIYLDGNGITHIDEDCFAKLPKLKKLYLQNNQLDKIPDMLPPQLEVLDLSYNNIKNDRTKENEQFFSNTPEKSMKTLDLCGNPMEEFPLLSVRTSQKLESLCVGDQVAKIEPGTAQTNTKLVNITMCAKDKPDTEMDWNTQSELQHMKQLQHLSLSYYHIPSLEFFNDKEHLETLSLQHVTIGDNVTEQDMYRLMKNKQKLTVLSLDHSPRLAKLMMQNLALLSNIEHVSLSNVDLVHAEQIETDNLNHVVSLDIRNNPLQCGCETIHWVDTKYLTLEHEEETMCQGPVEATLPTVSDTIECPEESTADKKHVIKEEEASETPTIVEPQGEQGGGHDGHHGGGDGGTSDKEAEQGDEDKEQGHGGHDGHDGHGGHIPEGDMGMGSQGGNDHNNGGGYYTTEEPYYDKESEEEGIALDHTAAYILLGIIGTVLILSLVTTAVVVFYFRRRNHQEITCESVTQCAKKKSSSRDQLYQKK